MSYVILIFNIVFILPHSPLGVRPYPRHERTDLLTLLTWGQNSPEAYVVVGEVRGVVGIAIANPAADGVAVPTAAAKHTV